MFAAIEAKQVIVFGSGCYSITYPDPCDSDWQFSMDYGFVTAQNPEGKNRWTCSESPGNFCHWTSFRSIPDHGYRALLDHFGLEETDVSLEEAVTKSPADLTLLRRLKEDRGGFEPRVIKNMRIGCRKDELADTFGPLS